jgi:WD40 repeat protein
VKGAALLSDGRLLSWSADGTLRFWDGASGAPGGVLEGHTSSVDGAMELTDGRILSWSSDDTLRLWNAAGDGLTSRAERHRNPILHTSPVTADRALSFSKDGSCLWDLTNGTAIATRGPCADARAIPAETTDDGETLLQVGRILTWTEGESALRLWDGATGAPVAVLEGHTRPVSGALVTPEGRVVSWSTDCTLRLWDGRSGVPLAVMEGHTGASELSALGLSDRRIVSWSYDPDAYETCVRVWDATSGAPLATLQGHVWLTHALGLRDGRILTWSTIPTSAYVLQLWDGTTGALLATLEGHRFPVRGALELRDGRILSWSLDRTLRIWDCTTGAQLATMEVRGGVTGATVLLSGDILSWGEDLQVWDGVTGDFRGSIHANAAFRSTPALYRVWREAVAPSTVQLEGLVDVDRGGVWLALGRARLAIAASWHADGDWTADQLLPDGTIVACCDRELAVLHHFHGNRRVNLDEARSIPTFGPSGARPPSASEE